MAWSSRYARATVFGAMPSSAASPRTGGTRSPGARTPERILRAIASRSWADGGLREVGSSRIRTPP